MWPIFVVNGLDWQCCFAGSSRSIEHHLTHFYLKVEKNPLLVLEKVTFAFFTQETWIVPSISSLPLMVWNKPSFLPNHTEKLHSTPYNSGKIHMQKTNLFTLSQLPLREQNESIFCSPILSNFRNFGPIQLWKDSHTKDKPIFTLSQLPLKERNDQIRIQQLIMKLWIQIFTNFWSHNRTLEGFTCKKPNFSIHSFRDHNE